MILAQYDFRGPNPDDPDGFDANDVREILLWKTKAVITKAMRSPKIRNEIRTKGEYTESVAINFRDRGRWQRNTFAIVLWGIGVDRHRDPNAVVALGQIGNDS